MNTTKAYYRGKKYEITVEGLDVLFAEDSRGNSITPPSKNLMDYAISTTAPTRPGRPGSVKTKKKSTNKSKLFNMSDMFKDVLKFEFGPVENSKYALALTGEIAFQNKKGNYVYYNKITKQIVEIGDMKFDFDSALYKVPTQTVAIGDIIEYEGSPVLIDNIDSNGVIKGITPTTGSRTSKVPRNNMFNMHFYTKIVSIMDMQGIFGGNADAQPGAQGFNPMLMMLMNKDSDSGSGDSMMEMMMLTQMMAGTAQPGSGQAPQGFNPMMMMMMMKDKDNGGGSGDMIQMMMLSQMLNGGVSPLGGLFGTPPVAPEAPVV